MDLVGKTDRKIALGQNLLFAVDRIQRLSRQNVGKFVIFMKNGKKVLTNREKRAKIVNCIIIARTAHTPPKSDKLYSSNLHKSLDGARLGGYAER